MIIVILILKIWLVYPDLGWEGASKAGKTRRDRILFEKSRVPEEEKCVPQ